MLGYGWAHWDRALLAWRPEALPPLLLAWLLLNVGTLWLNAARDQDRGDVLFGEAVDVPRAARPAGLIALVLAVGLASLTAPVVGLIAALAALLAVAYSHPATAFKGHPILGPAINVVGYGVLSPAAGYALVPGPTTPRTVVVFGALAITVLGATFAAQAFQRDDDAARGDRTLVVTHGPAVTLRAARACIAAGGLTVLALAAAGWLPTLLLLSAPAWWVVDRHLARWGSLPDGGSEADARRFALLGLVAAVSAVGLAGIDHVRADLAGQPVAGLATRAGHPSDRERVPPVIQVPRDRADRAVSGRPYLPR